AATVMARWGRFRVRPEPARRSHAWRGGRFDSEAFVAGSRATDWGAEAGTEPEERRRDRECDGRDQRAMDSEPRNATCPCVEDQKIDQPIPISEMGVETRARGRGPDSPVPCGTDAMTPCQSGLDRMPSS